MNVAMWVWDNKEWLFSGVGVTAAVAFLAFIRRRRRSPQSGVDDSDDFPFLAQPVAPPEPSRVWRAVSHIPGLTRYAQKRIFTDDEIAKRIRVTIRSEGDGISIYKSGEEGTASVYLDVLNLNPFPISLHPITGDLTVADAAIAPLNSVDRFDIGAQSYADVSFSCQLSKAQMGNAVMQADARPDATAGVHVNIYVETPLGRLKLMRRTSSGNRRFVNF